LSAAERWIRDQTAFWSRRADALEARLGGDLRLDIEESASSSSSSAGSPLSIVRDGWASPGGARPGPTLPPKAS
jgi:hypothetical protein